MIRYCVIVFLVITTFAFSQNDSVAWYHPLHSGVDPQKQLGDSLLQFYPIHIGDTWVYKIDETNLCSIEEIQKDTIMNNGKSYFVRALKEKNIVDGTLRNLRFVYERIDTATLQVFNFFDTYEMRMDSLLNKKGDTISFGTIYIDNGIQNIFGKERTFRTIKKLLTPFETIVKYSHGIGITQRTENAYYDEYPFSLHSSSNHNIVYAKVNGIEYGLNPLSVDNEANAIPSAFSLAQNYPNPFNPVTVINYRLPAASLITLTVYDVLGREVATLAHSVQEAGTYSVQFNAAALASGIYFYHLQAGDFTATKKMTLIK